jgi:hypothetical protein
MKLLWAGRNFSLEKCKPAGSFIFYLFIAEYKKSFRKRPSAILKKFTVYHYVIYQV